MRLLRIFITKNNGYETIVKFDEPLIIENETMMVKCVSVFWNYDNITSPTHITYGKKKLRFDEGYWTANMIMEKLKEANVNTDLIHHSRKIKITSSEDLSLLKLAPLLGFSESRQRIPKGRSSISDTSVNVNLGMKYISIKCNTVNRTKTSFQGQRDNTVVILPITTTQSLKGSVTHYKNINSETELDNGIYTELKFTSDQKVGDILLEIIIK